MALQTSRPAGSPLAPMAGALLALWLLAPAPLRAATLATTRVVAHTGQASPDGTGSLFLIVPPIVLGASGQAAFESDIRDQGFLGGFGIFRAGSASDLTLIARASGSQAGPVTGWPAPDGDGYFYPFDAPPLAIDASDRVAFGARLTGTLDPVADEGIFLGSGGQAGLVQVARTNQLVPGTSDRMIGFEVPHAAPSANDAGQLTFFAMVDAGGPVGMAFLRGDESPGDLIEIARSGQPVPGGADTLLQFLSHVAPIDGVGDAAFSASFLSGGGGIFRTSAGTLTEIARNGEASPDGNGSFLDLGFRAVAFNEVHAAAFYAMLTGTTGGSADNMGIFAGDGVDLAVVARRGDFTPGNDGRLLDIDPRLAFNDLGQVLFTSTITGAQDGSSAGVFRGDGGALTAIARVGDPAPGGAGVFSKFDPLSLALNDAGQAAFRAFVDFGDGGSTQDSEGLFLYDDARGLAAIARLGDLVPDAGVIGSLDFTGATANRGEGASGLNAHGETAYRLSAGGDYYVAVSPAPVPEPEPEGLELAAGAALLGARVGGRRRAAR